MILYARDEAAAYVLKPSGLVVRCMSNYRHISCTTRTSVPASLEAVLGKSLSWA